MKYVHSQYQLLRVENIANPYVKTPDFTKREAF